MKIDITARHFSPSDQLKDLVDIKVRKIEKFNDKIINCQVILTKESSSESVEILCHGKGHDFVADEYSETFEKALLSAIDKITKQIKRQYGKMANR